MRRPIRTWLHLPPAPPAVRVPTSAVSVWILRWQPFCAVKSASTMHDSGQQPQSVNPCQNVTWQCTSSDAASWHTACGQDELSLRNKRIRAEGSFTVLLTLPHVPGHVPSLPSTDATARVATSASHATIAACIRQAAADVLAFERKRHQEAFLIRTNSTQPNQSN